MATNEELAELVLSSGSNVVVYEMFTISHEDMSQSYNVVRNRVTGVTVPINSVETFFEYYPVSIKKSDVNENLDFGADITFGDLGKVLTKELKLIRAAKSQKIYPDLTYYEFASNDLLNPMRGPIDLKIKKIKKVKEGSVLTAVAPELNINGTGQLQTYDRFKAMREISA